MSQGLIGYSQIGDANQPSPSVWGDCPNTLLLDKGLGYFVHQDFLGDYGNSATVTPASIQSDADTGTTHVNASSATYGPNVLKTDVTNTDNNAAALFTTEFGQIVRNSGNKFWYEARIALGALGDAGVFVGLTTLANATRDVVADNPSNSAVAGLTAATVIGFVSKQTASAVSSFNAVYSKAAGTPVTVLADVLAASAISAAGGTLTPIAANSFVKFAIRFDGYKHLYYFVNGYKVAGVEVDSTFDQNSYLVGVVNGKTGAAAALDVYTDFMRIGAQVRA